MKKITLFILLAVGMAANAQSFYNFSVQQQAYADLQGATSVNNGEVWDVDDFAEIAVPFYFEVNGQEVNRFIFSDDVFFLIGVGVDFDDEISNGEGVYALGVSTAWIQDRAYSTGTSVSPIGYKLEGTEGNHILKLEVKNAGLEIAAEEGNEGQYYLSFQVWLYEADQSIEYHYGANNITDLTIAAEDDFFAGLGDYDSLGIVYGNSTNPTYTEYPLEEIPEGLTLDAYPANGTVYRFGPDETAGLPALTSNKIAVYPNPASNVLNLTAGNTVISDYAIVDTTGKTISQNRVTSSGEIHINVENLAKGMYFINVNGQYIKFVKN
ncbi:T9SS type A sorting domain-containing protein [Flavobacterium rhizosphaerae]|uniref:T9SS type A sorting domain-containing protein n=1 Tax=Flavobacterium rhizosphaerae TaxID=3163298 RepID=A0ABW8YYP6_9FLAO